MMANGPLSSVMITATAGLLDNTALAANTNLANAINSYTSTPAIASYQTVITYPDIGNLLTSSTLLQLHTMGNTPGLVNGIPASITNASAKISNTSTTFTEIMTIDAARLMGDGDLSKFAQIYGQSAGYRSQANQIVNSNKNSDILASTFTDMDALTTGGVSLVTTNTKMFGEDLAKLGNAINLAQLKYLGHPWTLLAQMLAKGGLLPGVYDILTLNNVTKEDFSAVKATNPEVAADLDLRIYQALTQITGDNLRQVKILLDVTTEGLTSAADLLNPLKMLPNSYDTLIMQIPSATEKPITVNVYSGTSVNSSVSEFFKLDTAYLELSRIIPADQASANQAWIRSLYQIKNITSTTLPKFAASTAALESNSGLGDINALTTPIPSDAANTVTSTLATGTGPNNTLTIYDFMGTAAGWPYVGSLGNVIGNINYLDGQGVLTPLTSGNGLYVTMNNCLGNVYYDPDTDGVLIPSGHPGSGSYASIDSAFSTGLIPAGNVIIGNIQTQYPNSIANINSSWNSMSDQLAREDLNLNNAGVDFANLRANNRSAVMSLAGGLHSVGTEVSWHGPAEFFAAVANTQNIGGQAVISSMREGRNIESLSKSGVPTDTQLKPTP